MENERIVFMVLWGTLIAYLAIMVGIGIYCRKKTSNVDDFVLGGRSIGPWFTAFAYGTSYFSAVVFVGYAGQFGWEYGLASTWIGLGNAFIGSLLAWFLLGKRTRIMSKYLQTSTMPEFFEKRYLSKPLKLSSAIIIFIFLIPYTASVYNGLSRLFETAFHIPYSACIVAMALFTAIYVILGGYHATALNDFVQGIIMLIGIASVVVCVLAHKGGLTEAVSSLSQIPDNSGNTGTYTSLFGPDPINLFGVVILTSLGTWGLPQMVQKFYAIKDEKSIGKGTLISTIFAIIVAGGCYFLGGFGRLYDIDIAAQGYDAIIPAMIEKLSPFLIAVVVILVLSASMSTLSSLVLASSSTLTLDMIRGTIVKEMTEKKQVFIMRIFIVVFIAISAVIAVVQYKSGVTFIAQLMGISWGALAGAFLAPFIYSLYWKGVTKAAVLVNFLFGSGIMVANMLARASFPTVLQSPINCGAFAMLAGLIIVPVVSLITPKLSDEKKQAVFSCYEK